MSGVGATPRPGVSADSEENMSDKKTTAPAPAATQPNWPEFQRSPGGGIVVLDLDNLKAGTPVTINGVGCRLRKPGTLAPLEARTLVKCSLRIDALIGKPEEL